MFRQPVVDACVLLARFRVADELLRTIHMMSRYDQSGGLDHDVGAVISGVSSIVSLQAARDGGLAKFALPQGASNVRHCVHRFCSCPTLVERQGDALLVDRLLALHEEREKLLRESPDESFKKGVCHRASPFDVELTERPDRLQYGSKLNCKSPPWRP